MLEVSIGGDITLKPLDIWHLDQMFDFVTRNRDFFVNWIPFVSKVKTKEDLEDLMRANLNRQVQKKGLFYTLWDKDKDKDKMIGYVLAKDIDEDAKWAEIGSMIDEEYAGRGLIKKTCVRLIDYLFDKLGMEKIVICCDGGNEASKAVAKALGFTLEGNIRNHMVVNSRVSNMLYYGLLKVEYKT